MFQFQSEKISMESLLNIKSIEGIKMKKEFTVVIEQDEDGIYVASVPELEGCHTQAKTLDELRERIKEAIQLYLEVEPGIVETVPLGFVGIQKVEVTV
jgi:predicted RNase H-like HicB family nuclease